jgi:predicted MFS family arabinose efflux permease
MLVNRMGTMVVPFMTLYLTTQMGYSVTKAGIVFGLFGVGAFCGAFIGGRLTDRIGFYKVQMITLIGGGLLFIVLGQMKTYPLICIFTFLVSFVNEAFRPANSTAIASYSKEENRTRSYSLNRLAINLGWAVGGAVGGIIAHYNYELLFWVDGFTNIAAAILMWLFIKPVNYKTQKHKQENDDPVLPAHRDKPYIIFIVITMFFACCFFQLFNNLPIFFKENLHLTEIYIGFLMALNGVIIALIEMILVYKLEGKRKSMIYITSGVALVGLSFLSLNIPIGGFAIALIMMVSVTFGEILSLPFMNSFWLTRAHPSNRGQYAALYTMSWSAAQSFGPMGGAVLADYYGFAVLWWVVGGLSLITALFFYKLV